jgi:hypothetical protein
LDYLWHWEWPTFCFLKSPPTLRMRSIRNRFSNYAPILPVFLYRMSRIDSLALSTHPFSIDGCEQPMLSTVLALDIRSTWYFLATIIQFAVFRYRFAQQDVFVMVHLPKRWLAGFHVLNHLCLHW